MVLIQRLHDMLNNKIINYKDKMRNIGKIERKGKNWENFKKEEENIKKREKTQENCF